MVFNVRDRLPGLRPVASVSAEMDSGFIVLMVCNQARLSSLRISASDFIYLNQTFELPGLALYSPRAMLHARSRSFFWGIRPSTIGFIVSLPPTGHGQPLKRSH